MSYNKEVKDYLQTGKYRLEMREPSVGATHGYFRKYVLLDNTTGQEDPNLWFPFTQHEHEHFLDDAHGLEKLIKEVKK